MKFIAYLKKSFRAITVAVLRFPVTFIFLIVIAVLNAISIQTQADYTKQVISLVVGFFVSAAAQALTERTSNRVARRFWAQGLSVFFTAVYYLIIRSADIHLIQIGIRTIVIIFIFWIALMWLPSSGKKTDFNSVFMTHFKAFFTSLFFSLIIWAGFALVLLAIDRLLFPINSRCYIHLLNIVGVIFAPLFYLSLIPVFSGDSEDL